MNIKAIRSLPKISSLVVNLKRSLFEIESMLKLRPKTPVKKAAVTQVVASRWNE